MTQTIVVKHFQFVCYDERDIVKAQAFTQHYQPANSPVSVLKRMNQFKSMMKIYYILK